jgi:hypothetical protein
MIAASQRYFTMEYRSAAKRRAEIRGLREMVKCQEEYADR